MKYEIVANKFDKDKFEETRTKIQVIYLPTTQNKFN